MPEMSRRSRSPRRGQSTASVLPLMTTVRASAPLYCRRTSDGRRATSVPRATCGAFSSVDVVVSTNEADTVFSVDSMGAPRR